MQAWWIAFAICLFLNGSLKGKVLSLSTNLCLSQDLHLFLLKIYISSVKNEARFKISKYPKFTSRGTWKMCLHLILIWRLIMEFFNPPLCDGATSNSVPNWQYTIAKLSHSSNSIKLGWVSRQTGIVLN